MQISIAEQSGSTARVVLAGRRCADDIGRDHDDGYRAQRERGRGSTQATYGSVIGR